MIDIHNHIIYDFDDGPKTLEDALEMLKMATDQGITDVFATSHFNEVISAEIEEVYFQRLAELEREVYQRGIPVRLHSGSEIFFHHYIQDTVNRSKVATLGGMERYVLMEFPLYLLPSGVEEALYRLTMDGYIPIIAHPERYSALHESPHKILNFIKYGGLLQVNAGSILGDFGRAVRRVAMWLLENQLVHFLGSDAHSPRGSRIFKMHQAARELENHLDEDYIEELVRLNAQKIIDNEILEKREVPAAEPQPDGFFSRVKKRLKLS